MSDHLPTRAVLHCPSCKQDVARVTGEARCSFDLTLSFWGDARFTRYSMLDDLPATVACPLCGHASEDFEDFVRTIPARKEETPR